MVDAVILRSKIINSFIIKTRPKEITYISPPWKEDSISSSEYPLLFRNCKSLFFKLLPLFCKKYNIDFHQIIVEYPPELNSAEYGNTNILSRIKASVKKSEIMTRKTFLM